MANKRNQKKKRQREREREHGPVPASEIRYGDNADQTVRIEGHDHHRDWGGEDAGRMPTAAELSDQAERRVGRKLRAAYYPMIGDAPVLGPADHDGAVEYLAKISKAIARGGWTRNEWTRLSALHKKWFRRANGTDPYFEVYGNRRQWADHATTYQKAEDKRVVEVVNEIKKIVWNEVQEQIKATPKDETPAERRARKEEIEAARGQLGGDGCGFID